MMGAKKCKLCGKSGIDQNDQGANAQEKHSGREDCFLESRNIYLRPDAACNKEES